MDSNENNLYQVIKINNKDIPINTILKNSVDRKQLENNLIEINKLLLEEQNETQVKQMMKEDLNGISKIITDIKEMQKYKNIQGKINNDILMPLGVLPYKNDNELGSFPLQRDLVYHLVIARKYEGESTYELML